MTKWLKWTIQAILLVAALLLTLTILFPPSPEHPHAIKAEVKATLPGLKFSNKYQPGGEKR
jgi:hypothetical protein